MIIEEHIDIAASAEAVMECYRQVSAWPTWDPDTREANIEGPFRSGERGRLRPAKGFTVPMRFISVGAMGFTVESPAPLCTMRFEHVLAPAGSGTRVTHRVSFDGLLAPFFGWLVGARVRSGLPVTLRRLKQRVEAGA